MTRKASLDRFNKALTIFVGLTWVSLAIVGIGKGQDWSVFCAFLGMLWWALQSKHIDEVEHDLRSALDGWSATIDEFSEHMGAAPQVSGTARPEERQMTSSPAAAAPPCAHPALYGVSLGDGTHEQWCSHCGAKVPLKQFSFEGKAGVFPGTICEGMHRIMNAGCQHEWRGPGEMPRRYTCGCGTVVFRSHEDAD